MSRIRNTEKKFNLEHFCRIHCFYIVTTLEHMAWFWSNLPKQAITSIISFMQLLDRSCDTKCMFVKRYTIHKSKVVDPHSFNADPDPAFSYLLIRIQFRIQGFDDQKLKKIYSCKTFFILIKNWTSGTSKHENSILFSFSVGYFCPPGSGCSNSN